MLSETKTEREPLRLDEDDAFARYCQTVTAFCPFLLPSVRAGATYVRRATVNGTSVESLQADLFYMLVAETEHFRLVRRNTLCVRRKALLCLNVVFELPEAADVHCAELLGWPHYLAKLLYTDQAILFGKFHKGEKDFARNGEPLPEPPVNFWSIRSRVENLDRRFFDKTPELTDLHINGSDDGKNVHAQFGLGVEEIAITRMREIGYYEKVLSWGREQLISSRPEQRG